MKDYLMSNKNRKVKEAIYVVGNEMYWIKPADDDCLILQEHQYGNFTLWMIHRVRNDKVLSSINIKDLQEIVYE